jgi:N6-adenosine-specific RNA methylase IME4
MSVVEIARLPIGELTHPDGCRLFLWITMPLLHRVPELLSAWGFKYCTARPWLKTWASEGGLFLMPDSFATGTGYEVRNTSELQIIAKRGQPQRLNGTKLAGHIIAPRREHSRKPDCVRDEIARLFDGPRCELFARSHHPGFDAWGNETELFDGGVP